LKEVVSLQRTNEFDSRHLRAEKKRNEGVKDEEEEEEEEEEPKSEVSLLMIK